MQNYQQSFCRNRERNTIRKHSKIQNGFLIKRQQFYLFFIIECARNLRMEGMKTRIFLLPVFSAKSIKTFDLITPESAKQEHKESLYFGYITD